MLAVLLPMIIFSTTIKDSIPSLDGKEMDTLVSGEVVKGKSFDDDVMRLVPQGTIAEKHLQEMLATPDSFTVVSLTYVPYPEYMKPMDVEERQVHIFNTMRSISTQEGITYISHRAGNKPKVLIEKSWYLEDVNSRSGVADPVSNSVPTTAEYVVFQRDSSFGSNKYSHSYETSDTEIFVNVKNLETMRVFSIFKAVEEGKLAIAMATKQLDDGLLLSAMATIEGRDPEIRILGISVDLPSAFTRRTTALGEWFLDQLNSNP
jgi:hypothetical protein